MNYRYFIVANAIDVEHLNGVSYVGFDEFLVGSSKGEVVAFASDLSDGRTIDWIIIELVKLGVGRICVSYSDGWPGIIFGKECMGLLDGMHLRIVRSMP